MCVTGLEILGIGSNMCIIRSIQILERFLRVLEVNPGCRCQREWGVLVYKNVHQIRRMNQPSTVLPRGQGARLIVGLRYASTRFQPTVGFGGRASRGVLELPS